MVNFSRFWKGTAPVTNFVPFFWECNISMNYSIRYFFKCGYYHLKADMILPLRFLAANVNISVWQTRERRAKSCQCIWTRNRFRNIFLKDCLWERAGLLSVSWKLIVNSMMLTLPTSPDLHQHLSNLPFSCWVIVLVSGCYIPEAKLHFWPFCQPTILSLTISCLYI